MLINSLFAMGCGIILLITITIIIDVMLRTFGYQPFIFTSAGTEYSLLLFTCLVAPKLLRDKRHIFVEAVRTLSPKPLQRALEYTTYIVCFAICCFLTKYSFDLFVETLRLGENEVRSIKLPRWIFFMPLTVTFSLLALEFARFGLTTDSMYESPNKEGRID